ncbi:MAG: hypothetical protein E7439_05655 [Ruminococcaceae bacterium]|nr:hypothetical protein [Oscillospiraceae bacterium]
MSVHEGHRERLRKRFQNEGLEHFEPHQVLELLLFYCIPRKDTNEIAGALIRRFQSFAGVLEAPISELKKIDGMGEHAAVFLSLVKAVSGYYQTSPEKNLKILNNAKAYGDYLVKYFKGEQNEKVYLLCLDGKLKVISCLEISEGGPSYASVPISRIVKIALTESAQNVVLAHNHPGGLAIPSDEDIFTTHRLASTLAAVDVTLLDHIVVADDDFVSLVDSGYYDYRTH